MKERISMYSHRPSATSQPSLFSYTHSLTDNLAQSGPRAAFINLLSHLPSAACMHVGACEHKQSWKILYIVYTQDSQEVSFTMLTPYQLSHEKAVCKIFSVRRYILAANCDAGWGVHTVTAWPATLFLLKIMLTAPCMVVLSYICPNSSLPVFLKRSLLHPTVVATCVMAWAPFSRRW